MFTKSLGDWISVIVCLVGTDGAIALLVGINSLDLCIMLI